MLKIAYTLFVIALASPLHAAPLSTWSGAGPNACKGRCSLEWAATVLTPSEHEQLVAAMVDQPEPVALYVNDGAVFSLSTYFKDGAPHAYRTTTVAVLDEPEPAMGWELDGWTFARLQACDNWTIVSNRTMPTAGLPSSTLPPVGVAPVIPASYAPLPKSFVSASILSPFVDIGNPDDIDIDKNPDTNENLSVVPLPASVWLLLASVLGLAAVRLRSTSRRMTLSAAKNPVQNHNNF